MIPGLVLVGILSLALRKLGFRLRAYLPVAIIGGLLVVVFGSGLAVRMVHFVGEKGSATITGTFATNVQHNNGHDVVGYNVLIRTAQGKVVETSFESDDFNIYPPKNTITYPNVGDHFTVYYIRQYPQDFIIVDNDDSPWATTLRCLTLDREREEAREKYEFERDDPSYRAAYIAEIQKFINGGCTSNQDALESFRQDIRNVQAGQP